MLRESGDSQPLLTPQERSQARTLLAERALTRDWIALQARQMRENIACNLTIGGSTSSTDNDRNARAERAISQVTTWFLPKLALLLVTDEGLLAAVNHLKDFASAPLALQRAFASWLSSVDAGYVCA